MEACYRISVAEMKVLWLGRLEKSRLKVLKFKKK